MRTLKRILPHRVARVRRALMLGALSCGLLVAGSQKAHALQGGEDPSTLPVLIDKRYGNAGKFQGYVLFSTPLAAKFTESTGVFGGVNYNFLDWLGVGVAGGFFDSSEIGVVEDQVRPMFGGEAPLPDLFRLQWMAGVDATITPLYGRISFASEYNPAFDLFFIAGGGLAGLNRTRFAGDGLTRDDLSQTTGYANLGIGTRFHVFDFMAARVEYRHIVLFEPDVPDADVEGFRPEELPETAISQVQQLQLGLQFMF